MAGSASPSSGSGSSQRERDPASAELTAAAATFNAVQHPHSSPTPHLVRLPLCEQGGHLGHVLEDNQLPGATRRPPGCCGTGKPSALWNQGKMLTVFVFDERESRRENDLSAA